MRIIENNQTNETLNFVEHTFIPGVLNYKEDINNRKFIYTSPEGLFISRIKQLSSNNLAEIHFTPRDSESESLIGSIDFIPEERRDSFRRKSVKDLIISLSNLIIFVDENPDTVLAKTSMLNGWTNKEMAMLMNKNLNINLLPDINPVTNKLSFYFECTFEDIKKGLNGLRETRKLK